MFFSFCFRGAFTVFSVEAPNSRFSPGAWLVRFWWIFLEMVLAVKYHLLERNNLEKFEARWGWILNASLTVQKEVSLPKESLDGNGADIFC